MPAPDFESFPSHSRELQRQVHQSHYRSRPTKSARARTDLDVLKQRHQFIREEKPPGIELSWEDELAEKWYGKLFREFALIDLKHYKTGDIGMRWRTEDEVISEKGERTCGGLRCEHHEPAPEEDLERWRAKRERREAKRTHRSRDTRSPRVARPGYRSNDSFSKQDNFIQLLEDEETCLDEDGPLVCAELVPFQLNFTYIENDKPQQALVKVMLCSRCQKKLSKSKAA